MSEKEKSLGRQMAETLASDLLTCSVVLALGMGGIAALVLFVRWVWRS